MEDSLKIIENDNIERYSNALERKTKLLGMHSVLISSFLVLSIISILAYVTVQASDNFTAQEGYIIGRRVLYLGYISQIIGLLLLFIFNYLRNSAYAYYEELSDELQWGSKSTRSGRPPMKYRVVIKEFLRSSDLPFIKNSRLSMIIYFILFISLMFLLTYFNIKFPVYI